MIKISTKVNRELLLFFRNLDRVVLVFGHNIHIYNTVTGEIIRILFQHKANLKAINENGQYLMSIDESG
jgi:hypothetical protein